MADISEQANDRWSELLRDAGHDPHVAARRFIQQVSDAAKEVDEALVFNGHRDGEGTARATLAPFILSDADPLESALEDLEWHNPKQLAPDLREALAKRGLKIVEAK